MLPPDVEISGGTRQTQLEPQNPEGKSLSEAREMGVEAVRKEPDGSFLKTWFLKGEALGRAGAKPLARRQPSNSRPLTSLRLSNRPRIDGRYCFPCAYQIGREVTEEVALAA